MANSPNSMMGWTTIPKRINISINYSSFLERIKIPITKAIIAIPPPIINV
jgi:hypothetical protein